MQKPLKHQIMNSFYNHIISIYSFYCSFMSADISDLSCCSLSPENFVFPSETQRFKVQAALEISRLDLSFFTIFSARPPLSLAVAGLEEGGSAPSQTLLETVHLIQQRQILTV